MIGKIRTKIRLFVAKKEDCPVLAGISVGIYMLLFYYSNNFNLANSWQQLLFFTGYFLVFPTILLFVVSKAIQKTKFKSYKTQLVFVAMLLFLSFFLLQNLSLNYSYKCIFVIVAAAIFVLSFKFKNYRVLIVALFFMSIFSVIRIGTTLSRNFMIADWTIQPDSIMTIKFKKKPNVYYIQTDGYANAETLKSAPYNFDNSVFNSWLKQENFTQYPGFRSNYNSTLQSNASCFNMLHHFGSYNVRFKNATDYIIDQNAVLEIFKSNGYKSYFITERPYLLMNRPKIKFDYSNFILSELPYLQDGWSFYKEIDTDLKTQIEASKSPKFFFIEKFDPGHIAVYESYSKGRKQERVEYLNKLKIANEWLREMVTYISEKDSTAIIIIGADHGGFVGFDYSKQAISKITDQKLLHSMFGAALAIKWNDDDHAKYDQKLKSSVNLFRTIFAFLGRDSQLLEHYQDDASYNNYDPKDPTKTYKAID